MAGSWAALFSGGKDSSWALYEAQQTGKTIVRTVTAQPTGDSYLYHTPATHLPSLLAQSAGIQHTTFPVKTAATDPAADSTRRGDQELAPLLAAVQSIDEDLSGGLDGLVVGAVESRFQRDRVERLCDHLGLELFAPLWHCDPQAALTEMIEAGFDIRIVAVAADGLDETWLGRRLDANAMTKLLELQSDRGIHPMGEGGEYETVVVDGPHLDRPLQFESSPEWDGTRGRLDIDDAWLAAPE